MTKFTSFLASACVATLMATSASAVTYTYVGSWQVDDGPSWTIVPPAYSGLTAAALLFGGSPTDYAISTIDSDPANIDFLAWVSTWGGVCGGAFPCGSKIAEGAVTSSGGLYQTTGDTSAYVTDWATGSEYTNYAFEIGEVPVPAAAFMLTGALGALAFAGRRKAG